MLGIIRIFLIVFSLVATHKGMTELNKQEAGLYLLVSILCWLMIIALILYEVTGVYLLV